MPVELTNEIVASIRRLVALQLWQLGAVKVNLEKPFKLASGNFSPIYINCRQLISSPAFCDLFSAAARILCEANRVEFDVVAGGETAGIPFAAILSRTMGKPMIYVRKAAKGHGLGSLVEGVLMPETKVLLTEDLITDAGSKLHFINVIKSAGATVPCVLVVFDRLQGGGEALSKQKILLLSVTDMQTALHMAESVGIIGPSEMTAIQSYISDPEKWHQRMKLPYQGVK
jgi:orotate phosphoribosyltransferase